MIHRLAGTSFGLSVALTPFGGLLLLPPAFLGALTAFDDVVNLTDDVLSVRQEVSVFVDRRISRRHFRPIDVGDIWERNETFAVRSIDQLRWPVPLEFSLAAFCTLNDIGGFVWIRMHIRPRIAHKRRRSWLVSIGKSGRFRDIPRKVCDERNRGQPSITRSFTREVIQRDERN